MFVVTISFTPVDDLETTGKNSVRLLLHRSYDIINIYIYNAINIYIHSVKLPHAYVFDDVLERRKLCQSK